MGFAPKSVADACSGTSIVMPFRLNDAQCDFVNTNVGVSRRTLKDVAKMFNDKFETCWSYEAFVAARAAAIIEGRCKTTYFRNYFKGENSSERELRRQRGVIVSRITGGCQFQDEHGSVACGKPTSGRYCEDHVRNGHVGTQGAARGVDYIDSSLGKYG